MTVPTPTHVGRNQVSLIGILAETPRPNQKKRPARNELGGPISRLQLVVSGPYGDPFPLRLQVGPGVPGALDLCSAANMGQPFALHGALQFVATHDARFADEADLSDRGQQFRALRVNVRGAERVDTTALTETSTIAQVQLTGTVVEPPRTVRHPSYPTQVLAATMLRVESQRSVMGAGIISPIAEVHDIPVMILSTLADAPNLFRVGNTVQVTGVLDCMLEAKRGRKVAAALSAQERSYADQLATAPDAPTRAQIVRDGRYAHRTLAQSAVLHVLIGEVRLLVGAPKSFTEAQRDRQQFSEEQRAERERRNRRGPRRTSGQYAPDERRTLAPDTAEPLILTAVAERPRRKTRSAEVPSLIPTEPIIAASGDDLGWDVFPATTITDAVETPVALDTPPGEEVITA